MREKLIKILRVPIFPHELVDPTEAVADYLLDNDVVPVVRCKDCKHGKLNDVISYKTIDGETNDTTLYQCFYRWNYSEFNKGNHFCSYGERKDNERKTD